MSFILHLQSMRRADVVFVAPNDVPAESNQNESSEHNTCIVHSCLSDIEDADDDDGNAAKCSNGGSRLHWLESSSRFGHVR